MSLKSITKQSELNIGVIGHVDHGKTTIVKSLTGTWTSSHSEELRRGITIKIGYADMPIYECISSNSTVQYTTKPDNHGCKNKHSFKRVTSIVDCPGHESLMANMLSGAALMDAAILVISANEPVPRPQTKEHVVALNILGVKNLIIVQNKIDLVSKDEAIKNYKDIKNFLDNANLKNVPIIPVSAIHNLNTDLLLNYIQKNFSIKKNNTSESLRMYTIRSFDINDPGTSYSKLSGGVIGGSILNGKLKVGDELEILPGFLERKDGKIIHNPIYAKTLSIHTQNTSLKEANSGGLIGVQTDLDPSLTKADGLVGNLCGKPGKLPDVKYELDMTHDLFDYVVGTDDKVKVDKISINESLRLNVGASVTLGHVTSVTDANVRVNLLKPVVADKDWTVAIARRVSDKWRLIGASKVT